MPPSLMVRQRQPPSTLPTEPPAESSAPWIAPISLPPCASLRPFARASSIFPNRCWSYGLATSCQPANAAVDTSSESAVRPTPSLSARISVPFLFAASPALELGAWRRTDDVEAGIHKMSFARDAGAHVAEQIECCIADIVQIDCFLERALRLVPAEHGARFPDHRSRQGAHRPRRNRVDTDILLAQVGCKITHARLKAGLRDAHDVVIRCDAMRTHIGEREQRSPFGHQRHGATRHRRERITRDRQRAREVLAAGVDVTALQFLAVRKCDGMDDEIQRAPFAAQDIETRVELVVVFHISGKDEFGTDGFGQGL